MAQTVEVLESCMVVPSEETPKHQLWISIFDLVQPRTHVPLIYLYRPILGSAFFSPDILKAALSKTLVPFYPIAGRLGSDSTGRLEIRSTGDGVLFVTARANTTLNELENLTRSDDRRRMLVPTAEGGDHADVLAMFQVTFLKCGGVCLGTAIHHTVSDGPSFGNFLKTWAAITRGDSKAATQLRPCLDRTLLRTLSSPPTVHFQHAAEYPQRGSVPSKAKLPFHAAIFPISKSQVEALKVAAGAGTGNKVSTFSAVVAHVWRCACRAKCLRGTEDTRVYAWANARLRIHPPLPDSYLGNATIRTSTAVTKVNDIILSPLTTVADKLSAATARLTNEYIRSLATYLENAVSDGPGLHLGKWAIPDSDLLVVSWIRLPIYDVNFGWGRPAFMGRATLDHRNLVYLVSSPDDEGPLNVTISMEPEALSRFKELFYEGLKQYDMVSEIHATLDTRAVNHSKL